MSPRYSSGLQSHVAQDSHQRTFLGASRLSVQIAGRVLPEGQYGNGVQAFPVQPERSLSHKECLSEEERTKVLSDHD